MENRLTLDTDNAVFFYEQDHYYLSNFSAFRLFWEDGDFDTSEHAYQASKFGIGSEIREIISVARSAHDAFKLAELWREHRHPDWDGQKVDVMHNILRAKVDQHEYVRRKLLETGERRLVENSWRDAYWGWGADRGGVNMLGQLWERVRAELREQQ